MKHILYPLFVLLCLCTINAQGSHLAGADITYRCIGGNQYEITLKIYRDCSGSALSPQFTVHRNAFSCADGETFDDEITLQRISVEQVESFCSGIVTNCDDPSSTTLSFEVNTYQTTTTLPAACSDWIFWISQTARNNGISNVDASSPQAFYVEAMLNNVDAPCNSSPVFTNQPIVFACVNQPFFYNHGVQEPDGDAISFINTPPRTDVNYGDFTTLLYNNNFSFTTPLATSGGFNVDQTTGQTNFNPTLVQQSTTAIKVVEIRNGVIVGYVIRDIQLHVINCSNTLPIVTGFNGAGVDQTSMQMQPGDSLCVTISGFDPDLTQTIELDWDQGINGATFDVDYSGPQPIATFCWRARPENCDPINRFIVRVIDSNCPIRGQSSFGFTINVPVYDCRDSIYITNRNHGSQLTVANGETRAGSLIKAGSNVPEAGVPMGDVVIRDGQSVTFIAGDQIIGVPSFNPHPSFMVEAGATFYAYIQPTPCEPACSPLPLGLECVEDVNCPQENITAFAFEGKPPYEYSWFVDDIYSGADTFVNIHNLLQLDDSVHSWSVTVRDRLGDAVHCEGEFCGRTVLYHTNLDTITYGWSNFVSSVGSDNLFLFIETAQDSVVAPYYKANHYRFRIWDSWGELIHEVEDSLGQNRLSFNNGEIHWDGRANLFSHNCVPLGVYNFRVELWNCLGTYKIIDSHLTVDGCWNGNIGDHWYIPPPPCGDEVRMADFPDGYKAPSEGYWNARNGQLVQAPNESQLAIGSIDLFPNPSTGNVNVSLMGGELDALVSVYNIAGQLVVSQNMSGASAKIDLSNQPSGLYSIHVVTASNNYTKSVLLQ